MNQISRKILTLAMLILILIGIFLTALAFDQRVSFADNHLELAIREEIGNLGKPIYQSQLHDIIVLDLSDKGIHDLSGLANLRYLERLNLDDNSIVDLSPLKSLRNLYAISLNNTGIIDLQEVGFDAISHLPLVELSLENNVYFSKVGAETRLSDITLLEKFEDLEVLRLNHNHIQDLSPLANLMKLSELELRNNHIERIDPLAKLTHLQKLDLSRNQIEEIDLLSGLSQLQYLNLRENRITNVGPLAPLNNLTYLNLHSNQDIQSINPLSGLTQLTHLILENIPVEDGIWAIQGMSELVHLNLQNCAIEDYDVIGSLMAQGALQDDHEINQQATVNIRDNLLRDNTSDPLSPIRPFWENIGFRNPFVLPYISGLVLPPQFSHEGGFFNEPISLALTTSEPELDIYYTLDGSDPDPQQVGLSKSPYQKTVKYAGSINIKNRADAPNLFANINTTHVEDVVPWVTPGNVYKGTVVRAVSFDPKTGYQSTIVTNTYFVDESSSQRYSTLPVISLTADYSVLFKPDTGILNTGLDDNPFYHLETRVPASIEFFEPGGELGFKGDYEVKLHGNTSVSNPQKGFHVYAEPWLGEEKISYPIFENSESKANQLKSFDRIILRAWGTAFNWDVFFSDAYHQTLMAKSELDIQDYRPAVLFINGEYWGLYEIRETNKNAEYFHAHYFDGEDVPLDILEMGTVDFIESGDSDHWFALLDFIDQHDIRQEEHYNYVASQMDINNFIQYVIHCIFTGKKDWPIHNEALWRAQALDGKWRWIQFDMDQGLRPGTDDLHDMVGQVTDLAELPHPLLLALLENETFKNTFLNTFADLLNTTFLTSVELDHFNQMSEELEPFIPEFKERWHLDPDWEGSKARALSLIENRWTFRKNQVLENFGIESTHQISLISNQTMGTIGINSLEISQDLPGVTDPGSWRGYYFDQIPIRVYAIPKEGYRFVKWEGSVYPETQQAAITILPQEDLTLEAIFEKIDTD